MSWNLWLVLVFSAIGATGTLISWFNSWRNRTRWDVQARVTRSNPLHMGIFGDGDWAAEVSNRSPHPVYGVVVHAYGGRVFPGSDGPVFAKLEPHERATFSVDVTDDDVERGWFLIMFTTHRGRPGRTRLAWYPMAEMGELSEVRARQIARPWWESLLVRLTMPPLPTPESAPAGSMRSDPKTLARMQLSGPSAPRRWWWQTQLAKRLPEVEADIAWDSVAPPRPGPES